MNPDNIKIIQQDYQTLKEFLPDRKTLSKINEKVCLAGARALFLVGMAYGVLKGAAAITFFAFHPIGSIFALASAVSIVVINRDLFIIATNKSKVQVQLQSINKTITSLKKCAADIANGKKKIKDFPHFSLAKGTLLQSMWNVVFYPFFNEKTKS